MAPTKFCTELRIVERNVNTMNYIWLVWFINENKNKNKSRYLGQAVEIHRRLGQKR